MTAIRKMILQMIYSQYVTDLATDYDISNDRFGFYMFKKGFADSNN